MSGHSKWSKVKHQKESSDARKGQAFTKAASAIIVAVREGGGISDPDKNFRLRLAVEKARQVNMPKDNIERAIERATVSGAQTIEAVTYEAYGPGGVALMIEATTDNRQRTVAEIKNVLERHGGTLAAPGAVAYRFKRVGRVLVPKSAGLTFDKVLEAALVAGADDVVDRDDFYEVYAPVSQLTAAEAALKKQGIVASESAVTMRPTATVTLSLVQHESVSKLIAEITELDDIQDVVANEAN